MPKLANVCLSERSYPVLCDPGDTDLGACDFCVVSGPEGAEEVGFVKSFEYRSEEQTKGREWPRLLRRAVPREVRAWHYQQRRESDAMAMCKQKAAQYKLPMKISYVRFDDRQRKITFYFTADKRIDFRDLVKDLATAFHTRIELWQIGVRDEARRMCGVGLCGRQLCCAAWLREFAPVSIRCAKTQDIQFSPTKLSGICGRLRCCLAYEQAQYVELGKDAPPVGSLVETTQFGEAKVVDRNLLSRTVSVNDPQGRAHIIPFSAIKGFQMTAEAGKQGEQIVLEPDETPEEASALLVEESMAASRAPDSAETSISTRRESPSRSPLREIPDSVPAGEKPDASPEQDASPAARGPEPQPPAEAERGETARRRSRRRGKRGGRGRNRAEKPDGATASGGGAQGPGPRDDPPRGDSPSGGETRAERDAPSGPRDAEPFHRESRDRNRRPQPDYRSAANGPQGAPRPPNDAT